MFIGGVTYLTYVRLLASSFLSTKKREKNVSGLVLKDKLRSSKYAAVRLQDSHTACCKFSASCINWEYIKNGRGREASLEITQKTWVSVTAHEFRILSSLRFGGKNIFIITYQPD